MSKRFGRNQKRRMRAEVDIANATTALLQDKLKKLEYIEHKLHQIADSYSYFGGVTIRSERKGELPERFRVACQQSVDLYQFDPDPIELSLSLNSAIRELDRWGYSLERMDGDMRNRLAVRIITPAGHIGYFASEELLRSCSRGVFIDQLLRDLRSKLRQFLNDKYGRPK